MLYSIRYIMKFSISMNNLHFFMIENLTIVGYMNLYFSHFVFSFFNKAFYLTESRKLK